MNELIVLRVFGKCVWDMSIYYNCTESLAKKMQDVRYPAQVSLGMICLYTLHVIISLPSRGIMMDLNSHFWTVPSWLNGPGNQTTDINPTRDINPIITILGLSTHPAVPSHET